MDMMSKYATFDRDFLTHRRVNESMIESSMAQLMKATGSERPKSKRSFFKDLRRKIRR
jgi:hypothetical protein